MYWVNGKKSVKTVMQDCEFILSLMIDKLNILNSFKINI